MSHKISVEFDLELPEQKEYPQFEQQAVDMRHEAEYLMHKLAHGHNEEQCLRRLKRMCCLLKKYNSGVPQRWTQELEKRITNVLRDNGESI